MGRGGCVCVVGGEWGTATGIYSFVPLVLSCYATLRYAMLCYAMLCYAMLCRPEGLVYYVAVVRELADR